LGAGSLSAFRLGMVLQSSIRSRWADQSVVRGSGAQSSGRPCWASEAMTNVELALACASRHRRTARLAGNRDCRGSCYESGNSAGRDLGLDPEDAHRVPFARRPRRPTAGARAACVKQPGPRSQGRSKEPVRTDLLERAAPGRPGRRSPVRAARAACPPQPSRRRSDRFPPARLTKSAEARNRRAASSRTAPGRRSTPNWRGSRSRPCPGTARSTQRSSCWQGAAAREHRARP